MMKNQGKSIFKRWYFWVILLVICPIALISLFAVGSIFIYGLSLDPENSGKSEEVETTYEHYNESTGKMETVSEGYDGSTPVEEIYDAFEANQLRASKEYNGKEMTFGGNIDKIEQSDDGGYVIQLESVEKLWVFIDCHMDNNKVSEDDILSLNTDDYIKIKGTVMCGDEAYILFGCEIVE